MLREYGSSNILFVIFISLILILITLWIVVKLIFAFLCIKFKCKITFKFKHIYQITDIHIIKLNSNERSSNSVQASSVSNEQKLVQIYIDKLWLSSCYLNRNINDRFIICFNNVQFNYYGSSFNWFKREKNPSSPVQLVLSHI